MVYFRHFFLRLREYFGHVLGLRGYVGLILGIEGILVIFLGSKVFQSFSFSFRRVFW